MYGNNYAKILKNEKNTKYIYKYCVISRLYG